MRLRPLLIAAAAMGVVAGTALAETGRIPKELTAIPADEISRLNEHLGPTDTYDVPPRVLAGYVPIYPVSRLLAGKTGSCKVAFTIGIDGRASDPAPDPDADQKMCAHALFALEYWRFSPAMKDGNPVSSRLRLPFAYDIR